MLKTVLVFLAGVLVGANLVYYVMSRASVTSPERPATTAAATTVPASPSPAVATMASPGSMRVDANAPAPPVPVAATPAATPVPGPAGLIVPVQGVVTAQLSDTFSQARSEGRVHEAIDIMAPRGTPVLAAANGTVEKLFTSVPGGLTIYEFEPSGRYAYYYAHLDRYADGLAEGKTLQRGEVIGYVGSTGNASPDAPHLHFAVFELGPERQWWKGTAINPYPLLKP